MKIGMRAKMHEKILIDTKETAIYLFGTSSETNCKKVRRLANNGKIPAIKDGRNYLFDRIELQRITHYSNGK
tara:strand:+ start:3499 stop:3714 length:216 start_codon:yes stop_codon:yes gene_type:complete